MRARRLFGALILSAALICGGILSASAEPLSADAVQGSYYAQLTDDAKLIYDALADPENLGLLQAGEPVTVGEPYMVTIPQNITQEEYNALTRGFSAASNRMGEILREMSNAAAAFDREHSDVFWTGGVHGHTALQKNGEDMEGSISLSPGNTYTISLKVGLYVVSDWDGVGEDDRDLHADMMTLRQNVLDVARIARESSATRYGRLQKVNELLCRYNDYNTDAAALGGSGEYGHGYPWTAFSALDQITLPEDENGSLRPVCEGYARALQLVCHELEIPCMLVSGSGNGEEHMWTYVQMEDGNWYAMDVTWNDTLGRNDYFLVGSDVMDEKHEARGRFMSAGQTTEFVYPRLSEKPYNPNKLTLNSSVETLSGGGRVILTVGGALEGEVSMVSSDESVLPSEIEDGIWVADLPNETAEFTFTVTFEGEGIYHGITASCTVRTEHTHAFGDWIQESAEQHSASCVCGEKQYKPHEWGEWREVSDAQHGATCICGGTQYKEHEWSEWMVTKAATATVAGSRERTCVCGKTQTETIAPLGGAERNTAPGAAESDPAPGEPQTQPPTGDLDQPTPDTPKGSGGCFSSAHGTAVLLCAILGVLMLRKRRT
ncbi:MAG: hypothetical protein IKJ35_01920 [Clostridia bacterium]|nr:hypothetical protein [Clostridia bacterium]